MSSIYLRLSGLALPDAARSPLLERMLARAGMRRAETDWRQRAYRLVAAEPAPMPGIGAAALCGEIGPIGAGAVFLASPVHCEAGMVSVRLPVDGMISLSSAEAGQLAREFNRDFADAKQRLVATPSARLFCVFADTTTAFTHDPLAVCGRDIGGFQPSGSDGSRLRRLMSEIEMWLHGHVLNHARNARGDVPITGLWLWGGGQALSALPALDGWTAGSDPLFGAWPARTGIPAQGRNGVVVLNDPPGSAAWQRTEQAWLTPALAALRAGRIRQLELSIGAQGFMLRRGWSLRAWRREQSWWEYLS